MSRVAVVGAGLAGLAAAVELRARGHEVELLERTRLLGGKATSFTVDGVEVDSGQHVHLACCTQYADFVAALGMSEQLRLQDRFDVTVLHAGRPPARLRASAAPAPLHLAPSLARYAELGWRGRVQVVRAVLSARRTARPGETAAAWLRRHGQGADALRAFWEPFIVPSLNVALEDASADALLFVVRTAFLADARAARVGWSRVPLARIAEAAAARCTAVHLRSPVSGVAGGARGVEGVRLEDGRTVAADAVVLAVPPRRALRILGGDGAFGVSGLAAFRTAPIVDVHLWYGVDPIDTEFAALLDSPVQWVFRKGPGYLCCSLSAAERVLSLTEGELVDLCHAELVRAIPALRTVTPVRGAAVRDPEATFVPAPGLRRPGPCTSAPNLVLAGAWTDTGWPATMESAVRSGRAAARALVASAAEVRDAA